MNIFEDFRKYEFGGNDDIKYVIEGIYNNAQKHRVNVEALHTKILNYMLSKREKSINAYLWYLKHSQPIIQMQINCEQIENKVKNEIQETKELINGLRTNTI